jgi:ligand-binding SRPBCC domain-containing protein
MCSWQARIAAGSTPTVFARLTAERDHVDYRLPYEPFAGLLAPVTVRPWLAAIFDYRARQTEARLR